MIRNFVCHILPRTRGQKWRNTVAHLLASWELFNGKKVIAVATDHDCDSVDDVKAAFGDKAQEIEWLEFANNPCLREVVSFVPMLERVASLDPNEITLCLHAKGSTHGHDDSICHCWADLMWIVCCDVPQLVECALESKAICGAFRCQDTNVGSPWHFRGTFYWIKHDKTFSRDWRRINQNFVGTEAWPGTQFEWEEKRMPVYGPSRIPIRRKLLGNERAAVVPSLAGESPAPWAVCDGLFPPELVSQAASEFPNAGWGGWLIYDSPGEKKLAANTGLPASCLQLLDKMNELCPDDLRHDPKFHAGGMHMMPPGGWLDLHLDSECHPTTGYKRHTNLVLFLDSWEPAWGGALELWDRDRREVSIMPAGGRAVAFDCRNVIHGIPTPTNPFGAWRRSLAVFWFDPEPERRRAQFLATPGELVDPAKDHWRSERAHS